MRNGLVQTAAPGGWGGGDVGKWPGGVVEEEGKQAASWPLAIAVALSAQSRSKGSAPKVACSGGN